MKNLYEDLGNMSKLGSVGTALAQLVESLTEGKFELKDRVWVYYPRNFVAFRVQRKRRGSEEIIVLSLWGGRALHSVESPHLRLTAGRFATYRSCDITSARKLAAAALYIEKAFELYRDSRNWPKGKA